MTPLSPQHTRGRSVPCQNNSTQAPSITLEHPQTGGDCVLIAPQPETETRKAVGVNSDTRAHSSTPTSAGIAGGTPSPSRQRNHSQRVTSAPHFLSATGAAVLRMPPLSSLCKLAGRVFGPPLLLALFAAPATADTCRYGPNSVATQVTIEPHETAFAVVQIQNKLAFRTERYCDLTIYGVTVTVEYDPGAGAIADWFRVTVPAGFVAVPAGILIDDRDEGQVLIVLERGLGA